MQKALLTGASGFLGKYLNNALVAYPYYVVTLGRQADAGCKYDLAIEVPVINNSYSLVVHAAGKAHVVPKTEAEIKEFYDVNLEGTKHLCQAFDNARDWPQAFVFISTVSVYGVDEGTNISESHPLKGSSPYAVSKIQAEEFLQRWCAKHDVKLTILRLPLIAGSNPPGNLGAMIAGIKNGRYFNIGGGRAQKSVVMAADVAQWIPMMAKLGGTYNLTDGQHPSFAELAKLICSQLGKKPAANIPRWIASIMAFVGNFLGAKAPINTNKLSKITGTLTFDDSKARKAFGWQPSAVLDAFKI